MSCTIRNRSKGPVVARSPDRATRRVRPARLYRSRRLLILEALEARTLPSFLPPVFYAAPLFPGSVAVADFNGDNLLDLTAASFSAVGGTGQVRVWLGNGDGTLRLPPTFAFGGPRPSSLVAGDFNGDRQPDLAVGTINRPHGGGQGVHVLLGRGDGTFEPARSRDPGGAPGTLAVGHFNSDDHLDLAVALAFPGGGSGVQIFLGNGDGSFQDGPLYAPGSRPALAAVGDFNGDGQLDLVLTNREPFPGTRGSVRVLLGQGDGTFEDAGPSELAGRDPRSLAVGDFNGDGQDDLAVVNYAERPKDDGSVGVLLGNGDGSFQEEVHYATGRGSWAIAVGDFNRDCAPDLAVTYQRAAGVFVVGIFLGHDDGTFQDADEYFTGRGNPQSIAVGDFNGDDYPDLALAQADFNSVGLLLNGADWADPGPCGGSPAPGAPADLWAAIAASLTAPPGPAPAPSSATTPAPATAGVPLPLEATRVDRFFAASTPVVETRSPDRATTLLRHDGPDWADDEWVAAVPGRESLWQVWAP